LKQKKFRELDISTYIQEQPAQYIERWISINDQDEFFKRIYFTIREIHTIVRNQEAPITTKKEVFQGLKAERAPRFDKILLQAKFNDKGTARAKSSSNYLANTI